MLHTPSNTHVEGRPNSSTDIGAIAATPTPISKQITDFESETDGKTVAGGTGTDTLGTDLNTKGHDRASTDMTTTHVGQETATEIWAISDELQKVKTSNI